MRPTAVALSALLALVACSAVTDPGPDPEPGEARVLGSIAFYSSGDPHVEVPATAERGVPFTVTVHTYGGGCHRVADTEVRTTGRATVEVAPFDFTRPGAVCTEQLVILTHTASVRFDEAGPARVRVRGRQLPADADLTVERPVIVR